jgi:protein-S-isoprenylcysteine O-methyltransferase Ste14
MAVIHTVSLGKFPRLHRGERFSSETQELRGNKSVIRMSKKTEFSKKTSKIEKLRMPLSRVFAVIGSFFCVTFISKIHGTLLGESIESVGFLLLMVSSVGRIWCSIYISGRKDRELCSEGPYSICRNPLYFCSFLGAIGFGLALQSFVIAAVLALSFLILYQFIIRSEESRLIHLFGPSFENYIKTVPRFFPAWRKPTTVDSLVVRPRIVERSMREVVWFLFVIIIVEVLEIIHNMGYLKLGTIPF